MAQLLEQPAVEQQSGNRALSAAILTLAQLLDRKGALSLADYRAELVRLSNEMGYEDAASADGLLLELIIGVLNGLINN